jgi:hypothetical protein
MRTASDKKYMGSQDTGVSKVLPKSRVCLALSSVLQIIIIIIIIIITTIIIIIIIIITL